MDIQPKISVIMPVYNGEKYLEETIGYIVRQTFTEFELLLIDDGSTDSSKEIIDKYAQIDNRVKYIFQENDGPGRARNNGIKMAQGDYLVFWDMDDFFAENALEVLYNRCSQTDSDICVCGAQQYFEDDGKIYPYKGYMRMDYTPEGVETFNIESNNKYILNFTNVEIWNKIYRKDFIVSNNILFVEGMGFEDAYFMLVALCSAKRISVVEDVLVTYRRMNKGSITYDGNARRCCDCYRVYKQIRDYLIEHDIYPKQSFANRTIGVLYNAMRRVYDRSVLQDVYEYLHSHLEDELGISDEGPGYFYSPIHHEVVRHILDDDFDSFSMFLMNATHDEAVKKSAVIRKTRQQIQNKNEKIDKLKEKNEILKEKKLKLSDKNTALKEKNLKLKEKNEKLKEKNDKLKEENNRLKEKNLKLQNSLSYKIGRIITYVPRKIRDFFEKNFKK